MDLLKACQLAYRKHHLNDDSIGWGELSESLFDALCNEMGDSAFQSWLYSLSKPEEVEKKLPPEKKKARFIPKTTGRGGRYRIMREWEIE